MPRKVCPHCHGNRWVDDENWSPQFPDVWQGERAPGNGRIPCGACNFAGWSEPDGALEPQSEKRA